MDVGKYLARIGISDMRRPDAAFLARLQKAHLFSVPYENLDIVLGKRLSLGEDELFDKIVSRGRGGYCFELNELFGRLLRALGYEVVDCFGRYLYGEKELPMRRHHVLLVTPPGGDRWLCDVGVGSGSPNYPVLLKEGAEQAQDGHLYRMQKRDFLGWVLTEQKRGEWVDLYSFTEEPQLPVDFLATSFFCERAEESIFNKGAIVSLRTPEGRVTVDGWEFRVFRGDEVEAVIVNDAAERRRLLLERFGLSID